MSRSRHRCVLIVLAAVALAGGGCALLQPLSSAFVWPGSSGTQQSLLPPIRPARDALQIDVTFVERPVGDPLLGNSLWSGVDRVGAVIDPNERQSLDRLGLRVGNAGTTPCQSLERLLQPIDAVDSGAARNNVRMPMQSFWIRSAEESPIETNSLAKCSVDVPLPSGTKEKKYENFKSILRLSTQRLQDGWARLEFIPEIHYGAKRLRPMPSPDGSADGWQQRESQEVDPLFAQRFSVKLKVGEMIVITADPDQPHSFGHFGFVREDPAKGAMQRLLVVRLSKMTRIEPIYSRSGPLEHSAPAEKSLSAR